MMSVAERSAADGDVTVTIACSAAPPGHLPIKSVEEACVVAVEVADV